MAMNPGIRPILQWQCHPAKSSARHREAVPSSRSSAIIEKQCHHREAVRHREAVPSSRSSASSQRKLGSIYELPLYKWIPAFAGMTAVVGITVLRLRMAAFVWMTALIQQLSLDGGKGHPFKSYTETGG